MLSSFFWKKIFVRTGLAGWLSSVKRCLGGGEKFLHYLSDRALAVPVNELLDPAWFPDVQVPGAINLAVGSPRCELPLGSLRGLNERRSLPVWGLPDLREEIAAQRARDGRVKFAPSDEILITHGATGAFAAVLDTFLNPGSKVVLFDPTSPLFVLGLRHRRARIRWVETWMEEGKTRFDIESFAAAMRGARMLVMADPVNPTGGIFATEDLEQIAWWAKKHDVLICCDESFEHYAYDRTGTRLEGLPHSENRLLTINGASKMFGLDSARVGWLMGCRHLLRPAALTASMAAPFVSPFGQQIVLSALRTGLEQARSLRDEFGGRRRYLAESLQGMGLPAAFPAGGYFFWIPVSHLGLTGRAFSKELLQSKRVLVNPGEPFGPSGEDFVRLSYATEEGRLREGLQRISEFMEERRKRTTGARVAAVTAPGAAVELSGTSAD